MLGEMVREESRFLISMKPWVENTCDVVRCASGVESELSPGTSVIVHFVSLLESPTSVTQNCIEYWYIFGANARLCSLGGSSLCYSCTKRITVITRIKAVGHDGKEGIALLRYISEVRLLSTSCTSHHCSDKNKRLMLLA
jgi:hypothetical protein